MRRPHLPPRLRTTLAAALGLWVIGGALLHLGPRDAWRGFDTLYYASPLGLLTAAALAFALLCRSRRALALLGVGATLALGSGFALRSYYPAPAEAGTRSSPSAPLRVAHWNIGRGTFSWNTLPDALAAFDADIICMVEARGLAARHGELQRALPAHRFSYLRHGFCVAHRVELVDVEELAMPWGAAFAFRFAPGAGRKTLRIVATDLPSHPTVGRGPAIAALTAHSLADHGEPTLLLGDFNTPRRSAHFDALRRSFAHAFEAAGHGFVETWPAPLPVLDLDHVWCGPGVRPRRCVHVTWRCSDHRAVIVDLMP